MKPGSPQRLLSIVVIVLAGAVAAACSLGAEGGAAPQPTARLAPAAPSATLSAAQGTPSAAGGAAPGAAPAESAPAVTAKATSPASPPTLLPAPAAPSESTGAVPAGPPAVRLSGAALVSALRDGGYVIYFRHARTNAVPDDQFPVNFQDCTTQRNLSEQGRAQAQAIGRAMRDLKIPIGRLLTSPFCRALETARLAFGEPAIESSLENLETTSNDSERIAGVRRLLSTPPATGSNTVLVSHGINLSSTADVVIPEGGSAIFAPRGSAGFSLVATLDAQEWQKLPAAMAADQSLQAAQQVSQYKVPAGGHPHDVAPAGDGKVWYTAQASGQLGRLDPQTGEVELVALGGGSSPHGVIVGADGAAWVTDSGLNAIIRVDAQTLEVRSYRLPSGPRVNLNTAAFDGDGTLWFTGQSGYFGRLNLASGVIDVFDAPRGAGPYGIAATPNGDVYFVSLAGSYLGRIDRASGRVTVLDPPTARQGARRVWSDSQGRLWISEWNAGQLGMYDPAAGAWREWKLPGNGPLPYAVYIDEQDIVWLSDFGANTIVRFDPRSEQFSSYPLPSDPSDVRQLLGRPGEVWGAESAGSALVVIKTDGGQ